MWHIPASLLRTHKLFHKLMSLVNCLIYAEISTASSMIHFLWCVVLFDLEVMGCDFRTKEGVVTFWMTCFEFRRCLIFQTPVVTICATCFNIKKIFILPMYYVDGSYSFAEHIAIITRTCIVRLILWWKHNFICKIHLQKVKHRSCNMPSDLAVRKTLYFSYILNVNIWKVSNKQWLLNHLSL